MLPGLFDQAPQTVFIQTVGRGMSSRFDFFFLRRRLRQLPCVKEFLRLFKGTEAMLIPDSNVKMFPIQSGEGEDIPAILSIFSLSTPFKDVPGGQLSSRHFTPWENFLIQSFLMRRLPLPLWELRARRRWQWVGGGVGVTESYHRCSSRQYWKFLSKAAIWCHCLLSLDAEMGRPLNLCCDWSIGCLQK